MPALLLSHADGGWRQCVTVWLLVNTSNLELSPTALNILLQKPLRAGVQRRAPQAAGRGA
jgi:hypothetical protein